MHTKTLSELSGLLHTRQISAVELAKLFLGRIHQSDLNAFLHVDDELTLAQARSADEKLAGNNAGKLTGIPVAHKDIFVTRGWRSTAASKMLANYTSPFDAAVVEKLQEAGMVTLGKLNCDEFAMGSSNENSWFGPVKNPWDKTAVPGGSSGGSAAATAARLTPAATATDTGGSIRQPSALCGVTGIKPTYGRVSRYGMIAYASSLDQGGPIAKTAEDCALLLTAMAGFDSRDSTSLKQEPEDFSRLLHLPLSGIRIGIPREYFGEGLSPEVEQAVRAALDKYKELGAELVEISLENTAMCIPVYYVIAPAEASSNLSRFDGVRYGFRAKEYTDLQDMYRKTRTEGFGEEVRRRIIMGTYVLSHGYYDAYYIQAQKIRRLIARDFSQAFSRCDVIMGPVSPTVAWNIGEKADDPVANYLGDIYTLSANLAGLPCMSIPCGFGQGEAHSRRPVGLQLIGNYLDEARLLGIAHQYQQATDWHLRSPV
ncbi:MAG: Asp-tRNA(Asn)/Glu-tRNA(Gln) amidotransferase subunit GatA [Alistipes senegalensis]|nr:Asp-tRNA(Asn)/Glu-tRNA(Gln) amidotransferase subunit GatA [Oxalobacter formigenes]MCM1281381.1 Asp-tRNA(Asn)/Glu-tRNA(Gln) amidotransferase subunit GatA [Alistipes senegalensis]